MRVARDRTSYAEMAHAPHTRKVTSMADIPAWLGAVGMLLVIAATLGAAVAVYKTNVQGTGLREAERVAERLRGEIGDYARREVELEGDVRVLETENTAHKARIVVLEDLLTKRQDDAEIRGEIAAVRKVVDENVLQQLSAVLGALTAINAALERLTGTASS